MPSDQELVELLAAVWGSIAEFGRTLAEAEWRLPTEVPGWSVQDNLAHITALEWRLLGRPDPEHEVSGDRPHVKNDFGRSNEIFVDSRRVRSGQEVLSEFEEVTAARLEALRALSPDGFGAESWTPMGPGTVRDLLPFRVFDAWVHEQDMREAVGSPGDLHGPVAEAANARIVGTLPYIVGKLAAAPEGSSVVFALSAPLPGTYGIVVEGRARPADPPADPTVRVRSDGATLARLACGRGDPGAALADGSVVLEGDRDLGTRVVQNLNFLF